VREIPARRHVDGDVVEADGALHDRPGSAEFEDDQHLVADAEIELGRRLGDDREADDVLPDGERFGAIGDGNADRAEAGGQRQTRGTLDARVGLDGKDHGVLRIGLPMI
jgi:hypothetical protein